MQYFFKVNGRKHSGFADVLLIIVKGMAKINVRVSLRKIKMIKNEKYAQAINILFIAMVYVFILINTISIMINHQSLYKSKILKNLSWLTI